MAALSPRHTKEILSSGLAHRTRVALVLIWTGHGMSLRGQETGTGRRSSRPRRWARQPWSAREDEGLLALPRKPREERSSGSVMVAMKPRPPATFERWGESTTEEAKNSYPGPGSHRKSYGNSSREPGQSWEEELGQEKSPFQEEEEVMGPRGSSF